MIFVHTGRPSNRILAVPWVFLVKLKSWYQLKNQYFCGELLLPTLCGQLLVPAHLKFHQRDPRFSQRALRFLIWRSPPGCGSKLNERRGKPQVLVHVTTYQGSILGSHS